MLLFSMWLLNISITFAKFKQPKMNNEMFERCWQMTYFGFVQNDKQQQQQYDNWLLICGWDVKQTKNIHLRFIEFHGLYWSISLELMFQYGSVCEISKNPMYTYTSHIITYVDRISVLLTVVYRFSFNNNNKNHPNKLETKINNDQNVKSNSDSVKECV